MNNREIQNCLNNFFTNKELIDNELNPESSPIKPPINKEFTIKNSSYKMPRALIMQNDDAITENNIQIKE